MSRLSRLTRTGLILAILGVVLVPVNIVVMLFVQSSAAANTPYLTLIFVLALVVGSVLIVAALIMLAISGIRALNRKPVTA